MEKIKNVLLQLSSSGNRMTGEIERQRLQSEKSEQLHVGHLSVHPSEWLGKTARFELAQKPMKLDKTD